MSRTRSGKISKTNQRNQFNFLILFSSWTHDDDNEQIDMDSFSIRWAHSHFLSFWLFFWGCEGILKGSSDLVKLTGCFAGLKPLKIRIQVIREQLAGHVNI